MGSIVEILPPHQTAEGLLYRATIYTGNGNERVTVSATVSDALRRRMAVVAQRALAWMKGHVRVPAGPLQDLMAGQAPACGCDSIGEAFRAACLQTADAADEWEAEGASLDGSGLVWSFDDWADLEDWFLPDVATLAHDAFGARVVSTAMQRSPNRASVMRGTPGLSLLSTAYRHALGH